MQTHVRLVHRLAMLAAALAFSVLAAALVVGWSRPPTARAGGGGADLYVSTSGNDGSNSCLSWLAACRTIGYAISSKVVSGDRIHVAAGAYSEHLSIVKNVTIIGTHPDQGPVTTVSGSAPGAVVTVNAFWTVTLVGVTIHNAYDGGGVYNTGVLRMEDVVIDGISNTGLGGGFYNNGGIATLDDVTISHNTAANYGGGIYNHVGGVLTLTNVTVHGNTATSGAGGGIFNVGTAILSDVVISGNVTGGTGGGLYTQGSASLTRVTLDGNTATVSGGGIANDDDLTLLDVTLVHNSAPSGGGVWNYTNGVANLVNTTLYSNTATAGDGGGLWNQNGTTYLVNVTFSANRAKVDGGGIYNDFGTADVTNATIAYNTVVTSALTRAGGVANLGGTVNLENTIVAYNNNCNCSGSISSYYGRNLDSSGDNTCEVDDDLVGFDPLLGTLRNNGGATLTHALGRESWAIDNGELNVCPTTDQRGFHRNLAACDVGAVEYGPSVYLPLVLRSY